MKTAFIPAVLCILLLTGTCFAQPGDTTESSPGAEELFTLMAGMQSGKSGGQIPPDQVFAVIVRELGLTEDQIRRIAVIFLDFARIQAAQQSRITLAGLDLAQQLLLQEDVDAALVEQRTQEIIEAEGAVKMAGIRAILAAREVLTPEQRKAMQSLVMRMIVSPPGGDAQPEN